MNDTTTDQRARRAALMLANVQRELYPLARRCGVKAYAAMAKGALVDAILAADPDGALAAAMVPDDGAPADSDDAAGALAAAIRAIAAGAAPASPAIDADAVAEIVAEHVAAAEERIRASVTAPREVVVRTSDTADPVNVGVQHARFDDLLRICTARDIGGNRLTPYLVGPPGTGKSTAAASVAKALGLRYGFCGALDSPYGLLGFVDAGGRLVRTAFRERWEHGGVFLFDEVDASHPSAAVAMNAALANGHCAFPDGIVPRHADTIIVCAANTAGRGGTAEFTGRVRQDAAFLDRFVFMAWPIDQALETALSRDPRWLRAVRAARDTAESRKIIGALVSPRAVVKGDALLAAGIGFDAVAEMTIRNGLADAPWGDILTAARIGWEAP